MGNRHIKKDRYLALERRVSNFGILRTWTLRQKKAAKWETLDRSPPGTETIFIGLTASVFDETPLPHIEIGGSKHGFPSTVIGSAKLSVESTDGKKTVTEYPPSSIIFLDKMAVQRVSFRSSRRDGGNPVAARKDWRRDYPRRVRNRRRNCKPRNRLSGDPAGWWR